MRKRVAVVMWTLGFVVVAGCSPADGGEAPAAADPTSGATPSQEEIREAVVAQSADLVTSLAEKPHDLAVTIARRMYAQELGVPEADVAVLGSEEVTWNDGSLGCPKAGESYTQVITPGFRITLTDGTTTAVYHAGTNQAGAAPIVIRCDKPAPAGDVSFGGPAAVLAIADLKSREGVTDVNLVDTFVAPVGSLICDSDVAGKPSEGPVQVILEYHLKTGDTTHVYRAWGEEILYCGTTADLTVQ
jgi:hypothetical protein